MRKLSFMLFGFIAIISAVSCTKEDLKPPTFPPPTHSEEISVSYSEWTSDETFSWEDGSAGNEPAIQANWDASDLTQETINEGGILVYAKSNVDGSIHAMPAAFVKGSNNAEVDSYSFTAIPGSFLILHTKSVDGVFETPAHANEMSFRFIFVKPNVAPANARIVTNNGSYSLSEMSNFSYEEVINYLGIPE